MDAADQYSNALAAHEDEDDDGSNFVRGMTGSHHTTYATHPDFGRPELSIDPNLDSHPPPDHHQQHQHQEGSHQHVGNHYGDQHMQRQVYADIARNASQYTLDTPSEQPSEPSPSQFPSASPAPNPPKGTPAFTPTDRSLPDRCVTDASLDDAYVAFILYCNPTVPLECDTAELRKVFRQPPKSDGKTFNIYRLLQLIEKFERKDIKTWTKLAIELGVERTPDSSAQKVQQYAVRLKRWMHAMHVDAFFEYILNKPHSYYQHIPPIEHDHSNPVSSERIRDGVPVEEDLALRALHPETRPKRGRRKTDDKDDSSEKDAPSAKRQHLDTGTPADDMGYFVYPNSAVPPSAGPDGMGLSVDTVSADHWTAATNSVMSATASTPTGGQHFRWRAYPKIESATTPHSAHTPPNILNSHDNHANDDNITPVSTTPTSAKPARRRRHGPAVSSAWPSSGNPLTGKLRGRPPSNRSVRDGPFSTFPANPSAKGGATIDMSPITATPTSTPVIPHPSSLQFPQFRPHNLHLTVPQQPNRPIAMASPSVEHHTNGASPHMDWLQPPHHPKPDKHPPNAPLLQAPKAKPPSLDELQRRFALAVMQALRRDNICTDLVEGNLIAEKVFASARRLYPEFGGDRVAYLSGSTGAETGYKGLRVQRLQSELEELGIHDPDPEDDDHPGSAQGDRGERRYHIRWETMFGDLKGEFEQIVVLPASEDFDGLADFERDDVGGVKPSQSIEELSKRVQELENKLKGKDRELVKFKEGVLRAVVS